MEHYVYVVDKDGNPFMPTKRYAKVRKMLRDGRAVVEKRVPFTIKLTYTPATNVRQDVTLAPDCGRVNIGLAAVREDGKCLFRAKCVTRNKEIPKLMWHRKGFRQASRRGERLARKRLAKKLHTTTKHIEGRILPGCEKPLMYKDIINTEARFNNRKRPAGWLTPTVNQLLQTHKNLVEIVCKILPVTRMSLEMNKFDFQKMENPHIKPWEYGLGPLHGFKGSIRKAIISQQKGKCLLCGKNGIDDLHHINPKSGEGSDAILNRAGICRECHKKMHYDPKMVEKLAKKKEGINKKYHSLSCLNQIMSRFVDWCGEQFPDKTCVIQGKDTKKCREHLQLTKDHDLDAYCIAFAVLKDPNADKKSSSTNKEKQRADGKDLKTGIQDLQVDRDMPPCYDIKQFRRRNRAIIKAQVFRSYYLDGKKVAQNRHKAIEAIMGENGKVKERKQKFDALDDWFNKMCNEHGQAKAEYMRSKLKVIKSYRRRNDLKRDLPGGVFFYQGKRYVRSGQLTDGEYLRAVGMGKKNFPVKDCKIFKNTGLVFL